MAEYQASVEARGKNTAHLRELRLAKEAADNKAKIKPKHNATARASASRRPRLRRQFRSASSTLQTTDDPTHLVG
jgi:hypothetical protein